MSEPIEMSLDDGDQKLLMGFKRSNKRGNAILIHDPIKLTENDKIINEPGTQSSLNSVPSERKIEEMEHSWFTTSSIIRYYIVGCPF